MGDKWKRAGRAIKQATDMHAAIGLFLFAVVLGGGGVTFAQNVQKLPATVAGNTAAINMVEAHVESIDSIVRAQAVRTDRLYCMAEKIFMGEDVGPFTCNPR